jgi:sporulation protein YlmC with PRC-barrel domain
MKQELSILTGGLIAFCLPFLSQAAETPQQMAAQGDFGQKVKMSSLTEIKITNLQNEPLGRIEDLTLDLSNGRVVEVLVVSDQTLRLGGRTVAVPPGALIADDKNKVYQINMSKAAFAAAPKFDLTKWADSTQPEQVAAAYLYFGQQPYFSVPGMPDKTISPSAPLVGLGVVERMSKLNNMPVENLKGDHLGNLETLVMDVPNGRILNVFVVADHFGAALKYSTIVAPTLFTFNAKRDGLVLDVSKVTYDEEAHVIFQDGAGGQAISYRQQPNAEQQALATLVQGTSARDVYTTAQIYKSIQSGNLDAGEKVTVATLNGRVTLRGPVNNQATKDSIVAIATAATSPDNVENQIAVSSPTQASL